MHHVSRFVIGSSCNYRCLHVPSVLVKLGLPTVHSGPLFFVAALFFCCTTVPCHIDALSSLFRHRPADIYLPCAVGRWPTHGSHYRRSIFAGLCEDVSSGRSVVSNRRTFCSWCQHGTPQNCECVRLGHDRPRCALLCSPLSASRPQVSQVQSVCGGLFCRIP